MDLKKRIIRNVLSNWAGYSITTVVAFFISPFVVHTLGNMGYGIWVLVGSLTGYLGIGKRGDQYLFGRLLSDRPCGGLGYFGFILFLPPAF